MSNNDGGPAFPSVPNDTDGMSLRDYFAGQALTPGEYALLRDAYFAEHPGTETVSLQTLRYYHAQQMLRAKGGTELADQAKLSVLITALEQIAQMYGDCAASERPQFMLGLQCASEAAKNALAAVKVVP